MTTTEVKSRRDAEEVLVRRAQEDEAFRRALLADPRRAIASALNVRIPDEVTVTVHEEKTGELHLVLPAPARLTGGDLATSELSDEALDRIAGGGGGQDKGVGDAIRPGREASQKQHAAH